MKLLEYLLLSMSFQNSDSIIIVTGLQRSGTSLIMQILEAAGLPVLTDNVRNADSHNINGYYEYSKVNSMNIDSSVLDQGLGKCLKIYAAFILNLPKKYNYKFIIMDRPLEEIFPSFQRKYKKPDDFLEANKINQLERIFEKSVKYISTLPNSDSISINFNDLIDTPETEIKKLINFLSLESDISSLMKIVDSNLRSKQGVTNLIKTDRSPKNIYKFIEQYTHGKVFCEVGIGEGYNLNKINNSLRKFGFEKNLYCYLRSREKYSDLEIFYGDAMSLISEHAFEVCFLWITYPNNKLIVTKILENNPNCLIIMGINYFYHLDKDDPKYLKYLKYYGSKASAENWNDEFDNHKNLLLAEGYNVEITEIVSETKELFSVAVISV